MSGRTWFEVGDCIRLRPGVDPWMGAEDKRPSGARCRAEAERIKRSPTFEALRDALVSGIGVQRIDPGAFYANAQQIAMQNQAALGDPAGGLYRGLASLYSWLR